MELVASAPEWALDATIDAVSILPEAGRQASTAERAAAYSAWFDLAERAIERQSEPGWRTNVIRQAIECGWLCLEVDTVEDAQKLAAQLRGLVAELLRAAPDADEVSRSRAYSATAGVISLLVGMSHTKNAPADLQLAFESAKSAVQTMPPDLAPEMAARRHQLLRGIGIQVAKLTGDRDIWNTVVEHGRLSVGIDRSIGSELPETPPAPPEFVRSELSLRWQGLSIAYRNRGEISGDLADLRAAVRCAEFAVELIPLGNAARGGALMALGGALLTLADESEAPQGLISRAVISYRLAVELGGSGSTRRQGRLISLGAALRKQSALEQDDGLSLGMLTDAIRALAAAHRLSLPEAPEAARALCDLANCIDDRGRRRGSVSGQEQAERLYRLAVARLKASSSNNAIDLRVAQGFLAEHLARRGIWAEALELFEEAITPPSPLGPELLSRTASRYAALLVEHAEFARAVVVLTVTADQIQARSPTSPYLTELRSDAALVLLEKFHDITAAVQLIGAPAPREGSELFVQGFARGLVLAADRGAWAVKRRSTVELARGRSLHAREALQRTFRADPARAPRREVVLSALEFAQSALSSEDASSGEVLSIYADGPLTLLPLAAASPGYVAVHPRPWTGSSCLHSSRLIWDGLFASDPALGSLGVEERALKSIYGERFRVWTGAAARRVVVEDGLSAAGAVHIAAHGQLVRGDFGFVFDPEGPALFIHELAAAGSVPRLTVLTVCPAAVEESAGRAALSVPEKLLRSGSEAVVSPLWPIRDSAAAEFARAFHLELEAQAPEVGLVDAATIATARARRHLQAVEDARGRPAFDERDWAAWTCWAQ